MKRLCLIGVLWALAQTSHARAQEANPAASPSSSPLPASPLPAVSMQEAAALSITQQWAAKSYSAMAPQPGPDGAVLFRFSEATPTLCCAVLQVTDVELEPGEIVNEVKAGDSERWAIEPAVSGVVAVEAEGNPGERSAQATEHVVIKPKAPGLQTSLIVTTDRRTYHFHLVSREEGYMEHVRFIYPDPPAKSAAVPISTPKPEAAKAETPKVQVAMVESTHKKRTAREVEGKAAVFLGKAEGPRRTDVKDHDFRVSGSAPFRPTQVYTDGKKTYIELPDNLQEAPVLFRRKKGGFLGLGHQLQIVNGRVHGRWYVADTVLDNAELRSGVGSSAQKIEISRAK